MQPANRPQLFNLPPLRLFREDLTELVAIFQKYCQVVIISDEKFTYESLEEMANSGQKNAGVFQLQGMGPHVDVWIRSKLVPNFNRSALFSPDNSDAARLLFLAIKDFLLSRRWKSRVIFLKTSLTTLGALFVVAAFLKDALHPKWQGASVVWNFVVLFVGALLFVAVIKWTESLSSVSLAPRSAEEPFWLRNRDRLLLAVFSAVIGAIIALIVKWLTK